MEYRVLLWLGFGFGVDIGVNKRWVWRSWLWLNGKAGWFRLGVLGLRRGVPLFDTIRYG